MPTSVCLSTPEPTGFPSSLQNDLPGASSLRLTSYWYENRDQI